MENKSPTWTGSAAEGYAHTNGAKLVKSGKTWTLTFGGKVATLPKRATFDHAEKLMGGMVS